MLEYSLAIVTIFIPQRMLHTQPTITTKVTICRNADKRLRRKAFTRVLIIVGAPQRAAKAAITVPEIDKQTV